MRKYLVDQLLFLIAWIGIMICIPLLCGPIFTFILETMVAISWGYLCRRILLLPFRSPFWQGYSQCLLCFPSMHR